MIAERLHDPTHRSYDVQVPDGVHCTLMERSRWIVLCSIGILVAVLAVYWPDRYTGTHGRPPEFMFYLGAIFSAFSLAGFHFLKFATFKRLLRHSWLAARRSGEWPEGDYTYREDRDCKLHEP